MGTVVKKPSLTEEAIKAVFAAHGTSPNPGVGPTNAGVNWTIHNSHMKMLRRADNMPCFGDMPGHIRQYVGDDIRYVVYNAYFKGNEYINRDECLRYLEYGLKNGAIIATSQTALDILERGYTVDLLHPNVTIDRMYAALCTVRYFHWNRVFVKSVVQLCDAGIDYWIAYCLCHELFITDYSHSWYPTCRGYSYSDRESGKSAKKKDIWRIKHTRNYFGFNKGKPRHPHALTYSMRNGTFAWSVASTVSPEDKNELIVDSHEKIVDKLTMSIITDDVSFDVANLLVNTAKKTEVASAAITASEEFRIA